MGFAGGAPVGGGGGLGLYCIDCVLVASLAVAVLTVAVVVAVLVVSLCCGGCVCA